MLESYLRGLRSAQRYIYLENQFLWSPEVAAVLVDKLSRPPADEFRMLLVLPARPNSGRDDTRGVLGELVEADAGAGQARRVHAVRAVGRGELPDLRPREGGDRR